jgi:hypothetical protein
MPNPSRSQWLAINYAATIFISAFLLFQVQPVVSKYILPWFGGSPAVWTTCMLFFQTLLFAGYAYAHFSTQKLKPPHQALLHLAIILMALVLLKVVPGDEWKPTDNREPISQILILLAASVGLPYFVLSTTGPLLQSWFSKSFPGRSPYRLYALSNIGSLLALLSYPIFFERMFDVKSQAFYWQWGFGVFAFLCAVAGVCIWNRGPSVGPGEAFGVEGINVDSSDTTGHAPPPLVKPHWYQAASWLLLPALASVTLLATTNHVCTDVAVMPFLWVVPLSLYLLTFIIAFDHPRWYKPALIAAITAAAIYGVAIGMGTTDLFDCGIPGKVIKAIYPIESGQEVAVSPEIHIGLITYLALNFVAMFGICMLCHGELVRQRPHPKYLTAFYLLISAGGAIGGIAVTLIAPQVFRTFYEWELATFFGFVLCTGILLWAIYKWMQVPSVGSPNNARASLGWIGIAAVAAIGLIGWIDLNKYLAYPTDGVLNRTRNFFGTLSVREFDKDNDDHYVIFKHGATTHGLQFANGERKRQPTTYYTEYNGVGRLLNYLQGVPQAPALVPDSDQKVDRVFPSRDGQGEASGAKNDRKLKIGAVGLGVGTLSAYMRPGDAMSFYEIDPAVLEIASNKDWFTYLSDCKQRGAECELKLGDARLVMERELKDGHPQKFDVLILDAFSGDAIPAHLLTEEAFDKVYLPQLAKAADGHEGCIAVHITNHYVNLEPVIRGLAEKFGFDMVRIYNQRVPKQGIYRSDWIVLTRDKELAAALAPYSVPRDIDPTISFTEKTPVKPSILWTDGKSNLFDVLK